MTDRTSMELDGREAAGARWSRNRGRSPSPAGYGNHRGGRVPVIR